MKQALFIGAVAAMLVFAILFSGCDHQTPSSCGNGACDKNAGETISSCPADCNTTIGPAKPSCGDGICQPLEKNGTISCPKDCGTAGGGTGTGETTAGKCGDGKCDAVEKATPALCPGDCGGTQDLSYDAIYDMVYATVNGEQLKLDIYLPKEKSTKAMPAVFEVHGGAFKEGDKKPSQWAAGLTQQGYVVVAVNYRLSGEAIFPAAINDVKAAVRWMRANAGDYDVDDSKFGAVGGSAGGSLVALLGTSGNSSEIDGNVGDYDTYSSKVQAVVDEFGPVNFNTLAQDRIDAGQKDNGVETEYLGCDIAGTEACANKDLASAVHFIDAKDPPFLILHGLKDDQIPPKQSEDFYKALVMAGVDANIILIPNAGHGGPEFNNYRADVIDFFDKRLK